MKTYNYIYLITNNINGKIYIGKHSTDNLDDGYMGSGKLIKKAIQKYGIENFTKEYLAFCDTEDKLNWLEKFYIKKCKAREVGYNLTEGGDGSLGRKLTEEHKRRISEANKGAKNHFYGVRRYGNNNPFYGKHHSEETKEKNRQAHLNKKASEETKLKMSLSHQCNIGENNPFYGKHHSEETKKKISEALKRRYQIKHFEKK